MDMPDSCRNDTKGCAREDVGVVPLTGLKPLSKPFKGRKRRAGGKDCSALGVCVGSLSCAFCFASRVGESKYDGSLVQLSHFLENLWRKHSWDCCGSNQAGWLYISDNLHE